MQSRIIRLSKGAAWRAAWLSRMICLLIVSGSLGLGPTAVWAQCPCSVFSSSSAPSVSSATDSAGVELGMKFRVTTSGTVTALRFFKGAANTGVHVGNLWRSDGTLLASATYANETGSGWQQVNLTTPVTLSPSFTYIVSYYAPNGGYAYTSNFFASQGVTNGPLLAPGSADAGGNGVYAYGSQSTFPGSSYQGTNYWVDVVFNDTPVAEASHPVLLVTDSANKFSGYVGEILLAEGLNGYVSSDIGAVTSSLLSKYDVVIVGDMALTAAQVTLFSDWVSAGGKLITLRPDRKLAPLLGLVDSGL